MASVDNCTNILDDLRDYHDLLGNTAVAFAVQIVFGVTILLSAVINVLLTVVIVLHRYLYSVRSFFLISLFMSDLLLTATVGVINPVVTFTRVWHFGNLACRTTPLIQGMSVFISSFVLTAIAVDRFIMIVTPARQPFRARHAVVISVVIWLLSLCFSLPPLLYTRLESIEVQSKRYCGQFCLELFPRDTSYKKWYGLCALCLQFIIPLLVITFCYVCIFVTLHQLVERKLDRCLLREHRRNQVIRQHQRTTRLLVWMVVVFVCSWLPQNVFNILNDLNLLPEFVERQKGVTSLIVQWVALSSALWNPVVYAGMNDQLKQGVADLTPEWIKMLFRRRDQPDSQLFARELRNRIGSLPINEAHQTLRQTVAKHLASIQEGSTTGGEGGDFLNNPQQLTSDSSDNRTLSLRGRGRSNALTDNLLMQATRTGSYRLSHKRRRPNHLRKTTNAVAQRGAIPERESEEMHELIGHRSGNTSPMLVPVISKLITTKLIHESLAQRDSNNSNDSDQPPPSPGLLSPPPNQLHFANGLATTAESPDTLSESPDPRRSSGGSSCGAGGGGGKGAGNRRLSTLLAIPQPILFVRDATGDADKRRQSHNCIVMTNRNSLAPEDAESGFRNALPRKKRSSSYSAGSS